MLIVPRDNNFFSVNSVIELHIVISISREEQLVQTLCFILLIRVLSLVSR